MVQPAQLEEREVHEQSAVREENEPQASPLRADKQTPDTTILPLGVEVMPDPQIIHSIQSTPTALSTEFYSTSEDIQEISTILPVTLAPEQAVWEKARISDSLLIAVETNIASENTDEGEFDSLFAEHPDIAEPVATSAFELESDSENSLEIEVTDSDTEMEISGLNEAAVDEQHEVVSEIEESFEGSTLELPPFEQTESVAGFAIASVLREGAQLFEITDESELDAHENITESVSAEVDASDVDSLETVSIQETEAPQQAVNFPEYLQELCQERKEAEPDLAPELDALMDAIQQTVELVFEQQSYVESAPLLIEPTELQDMTHQPGETLNITDVDTEAYKFLASACQRMLDCLGMDSSPEQVSKFIDLLLTPAPPTSMSSEDQDALSTVPYDGTRELKVFSLDGIKQAAQQTAQDITSMVLGKMAAAYSIAA